MNYNCPWFVNVHVVLIHACNMKENALASCISFARSHRVKSGDWMCVIEFCVCMLGE